jgi:hypothetical protein
MALYRRNQRKETMPEKKKSFLMFFASALHTFDTLKHGLFVLRRNNIIYFQALA